MIFVTLGTQKQDFSRLLNYIEKSKIKDEIIVQAGYTKFKSKKMKIFDFVSYEEMMKYIKKADLIITHSGTGSVLTPLKLGKKVIVCSRLSKYGEHVDDHQKQLTEALRNEGYILELDENTSLDSIIKKIKTFKPKKYVSNSENFINKLDEEINRDNLKKVLSFSDLLLLIIVGIILLFGFVSIIRTPKETSLVENRTLTQFENFQISKFISGSFQDNLEDSLSDQFVGGETIKKIMGSTLNMFNALNSSTKICNNNYVSVGEGFYTYNCDDYFVNSFSNFDLKDKDYLNFRISELNKINEEVDTYYYIINRSFNINFINGEYAPDLVSYLETNLKNYKKMDSLKIKDYETYSKYFYKTDHHWNYEGSYQGYVDIANMFGFKDIKIPEELIEFDDTIFYGSIARKLSFYDVKEKFKAYRFYFDEHEEYVDGNLSEYGNYEQYFQGKYSNNSLVNHYAVFYGGDNGLVKFNYNDNSKDNLLVLSSSFANPIKPLIASHFNESHFVDLRHFEDFDFYEYIRENDINKVLFIADLNFLNQQDFELGVK